MGSRCSRACFARSANTDNSNNVWGVFDDGNLNNNNYNNNGVRPVITISREKVLELING